MDALEPEVVADVQLPLAGETDRARLGRLAEDAWEQIARGFRTEEEAVADLERLIVQGYESGNHTWRLDVHSRAIVKLGGRSVFGAACLALVTGLVGGIP